MCSHQLLQATLRLGPDLRGLCVLLAPSKHLAGVELSSQADRFAAATRTSVSSSAAASSTVRTRFVLIARTSVASLMRRAQILEGVSQGRPGATHRGHRRRGARRRARRCDRRTRRFPPVAVRSSRQPAQAPRGPCRRPGAPTGFRARRQVRAGRRARAPASSRRTWPVRTRAAPGLCRTIRGPLCRLARAAARLRRSSSRVRSRARAASILSAAVSTSESVGVVGKAERGGQFGHLCADPITCLVQIACNGEWRAGEASPRTRWRPRGVCNSPLRPARRRRRGRAGCRMRAPPRPQAQLSRWRGSPGTRGWSAQAESSRSGPGLRPPVAAWSGRAALRDSGAAHRAASPRPPLRVPAPTSGAGPGTLNVSGSAATSSSAAPASSASA